MRFRDAHKRTTYAMAVSAALSVGLSGVQNPFVVLLAFVGIIGSWFLPWSSLRSKSSMRWTVLAVVVFCYQLVSVLGGADVIVAGADFLLFLLVVKLFNRRESRDYAHIYIVSFLLLTIGTVVNTEITYGFFFLCYVVSATWAVTLFHLRREIETAGYPRHHATEVEDGSRVERVLNSDLVVGRGFFWGTAAVSLGMFAVAVFLFLVVPRIGMGLFFDKGRSAISMAGFHDGVRLGGHGLIKSDDTVVMRVVVDAEYQGRTAPTVYWRGVAFDRYIDGEWQRSVEAPLGARRVEFGRRSTTHHLLYQEKGITQTELARRKERGLRQEIYLEPLGYDVLFGASMPLAMEIQTTWRSKTHVARNDELRHAHSTGMKYVVYSDLRTPSVARLRQAPPTIPDGFDVYLQVPPEIPHRVHELARTITQNATNNYDKLVAIEAWLKANLGYSLFQQSPGESEPIDFFLFERKEGHCEYFSSTMAILARSVGVPTRNVNGFLGGEWNEYDEYIAVRAGDAHSWVEAYFDSVGWVTFDPTPSTTAELGRGDVSFLDRMRRMADTVRFRWFRWVIEYDLHQQVRLFRKVGGALKGGARSTFHGPVAGIKRWIARHKWMVLFVALASVFFGWAVHNLRRLERGGHKVGRIRPLADSPVAREYRATLRFLSKRGLLRKSSITPREFAQDLAKTALTGTNAFSRLTEMYYQATYGHHGGQDRGAARELRKEVVAHVRGPTLCKE